MADIAAEAGVSKNTVSLALRGDRQIPESTRARIIAVARRLKYRKNATVARLMAEMRRTRAPRFHSVLALWNANPDRKALGRHPTLPAYVAGCRRRAQQLGYMLDEFWMHEEDLDGGRWNAIFRTRGIQGVLVVGLMRENRLPSHLMPVWLEFPAVVTGVRTEDPSLSFSCTDHHMLALRAFRRALGLGYRRPALVLDPVIDRLVDGRFSAGMRTAQQEVPVGQRLRPFFSTADTLEEERRFQVWFRREKPDVILTLYHDVRRWLSRLSLAVPRDIGLIQLEWREDSPDWAGMNQHNDVVGEAAVEMLVGMIHNNERGIPVFPRATLVESTWVEGTTVAARRRGS